MISSAKKMPIFGLGDINCVRSQLEAGLVPGDLYAGIPLARGATAVSPGACDQPARGPAESVGFSWFKRFPRVLGTRSRSDRGADTGDWNAAYPVHAACRAHASRR